MNIDNNIKNGTESFEHIAKSDPDIDHKLDELIHLLADNDIDSDKARQYKKRFNQAIDNFIVHHKGIGFFGRLSNKRGAVREDRRDNFTLLLSAHQSNGRVSRKYIRVELLNRVILAIISLIMITLGFAMIIMPAPPYFEMFTIFYFNRDDGVTLMDLISLLIIFAGIYLFIRAVTKPLGLKR